jgi:hypothetical protein
LKRYKSPGIDHIPAELLQAGGEILRSEFQNLITSPWKKEESPDQQESIIVPLHKKSDKTDCSNYDVTAINFIPNLSNIILSRLSPHIDVIYGDFQ